MSPIGKNIKKLRTKLGISQNGLARKAEFKYSTLAKIVKGLCVSMEDLLK